MAPQEGAVCWCPWKGILGCWDEEPRDGWRGTMAVSSLSPGAQGVVLVALGGSQGAGDKP